MSDQLYDVDQLLIINGGRELCPQLQGVNAQTVTDHLRLFGRATALHLVFWHHSDDDYDHVWTNTEWLNLAPIEDDGGESLIDDPLDSKPISTRPVRIKITKIGKLPPTVGLVDPEDGDD